MSKEELFIALLKLKQSLAGLRKSKSNNVEIEKTRNIFNELKNRFSKEKINEIMEKFYGREEINKYFKNQKEKIIQKAKKNGEKVSKRTGEKISRRTRKVTTLRTKEYFKKD